MHKFAELAPLKMSHNPLRHNSITRNWLRLSNSHPPADPLSQEWGSPERRNAPKSHPIAIPPKQAISPLLPFWLCSVESTKPPKSMTSSPRKMLRSQQMLTKLKADR